MSTKTVLVIEDNEMNLKLVRALLTLGKHHILEARNAETGIELALQNKPHLILMDIQLPGMDGLEATRRIKAHSEMRRIPVVALTSYAMEGDEKKALQVGCAGYISKPIDTRQFLKILSHYLERQE